jgi:hypothetical protein
MSYLPAQVKISWKKPNEIDDITSIEVYKYRRKLTRCEDYIKYGEKIYETTIIYDGEYVDEIRVPHEPSYAVFCKNEISRSPCVIKVHKVYPDRDMDGIEDNVDDFLQDTDNDGIKNDCDADNPSNRFSADTDGDNIIDKCDTDDDGDGIIDTEDPFPLDYNRKLKVTIGLFEYEQDYPHGAMVGLIASPNLTDQENFLEWNGEVEDPTELTTSIKMDKDQDVVAVFGQELYGVTIEIRDENANTITNATVNGGGQRPYGGIVTVSVVPDAGFEFIEWQGQVFLNKYDAITTFYMPRQDAVIYAVIKQI